MPRRKRLNRKERLKSGKSWIPSYTGKNIVKGYSNWYGTDLLCSIKELRLHGVLIDESYEKKVIQSLEANISSRQINKENAKKKYRENFDELSGENFKFIVGYTSGGVAFGIPYEESNDPEN